MLSLLCRTPFFFLLTMLILWPFETRAIFLNRNGCGESKACFFKPAGCDPELDCTIGVIFFVSGPNKLTVQMVAQSLMPTPQLQYIAIGFSNDSTMGDDFVTECVLSPESTATFIDSEVFASYNNGKTNDRTRLNTTEHAMMYDQIEGQIVDGLLKCSFVQTLVPQFKFKWPEKLWNLNGNFFVMAATGTAQPDEVNAHDTSMGSHFYPIVSARAVNPSMIGEHVFPLPKPVTKTAVVAHPIKLTPHKTVIRKPEQHKNNKTSDNSGSAATWPILLALTSLAMSMIVRNGFC